MSSKIITISDNVNKILNPYHSQFGLSSAKNMFLYIYIAAKQICMEIVSSKYSN